MKEKKKNRRSIVRKIINLSPLVDVFMIVIFWYIMFSNQKLQTQEQEALRSIEEMEQELEDLKSQNGLLEEELQNSKAQKELLEEEKEELLDLMKQEGLFVILKLGKEKDNPQNFSKEEISENNNAGNNAGNNNAGNNAGNNNAGNNTGNNNAENYTENNNAGNYTEDDDAGNQGDAPGYSEKEMLKITIGEESREIFFERTQQGRRELAEHLKAVISGYFSEEVRLYVIFCYDGERSYHRDIDIVTATLEELQKERYFVFTKMNLNP